MSQSHDTVALLSCPFCGGAEAILVEAVFTERDAAEEGWDQTQFWFVSCPCGAVHGDYPGHVSEAEAVERWNSRSQGVVN